MDSDDVNALVTIHVTLELQQAGNVNHGIFKVGFLFLNEAINHPFYLNSSTEYKNQNKRLLIYLRFIKDMWYLRSPFPTEDLLIILLHFLHYYYYFSSWFDPRIYQSFLSRFS